MVTYRITQQHSRQIGTTLKPQMHTWASTSEAQTAARAALRVPYAKLPGLASRFGADELYSEALAILAECALPPRDTSPTSCAGCGASLANKRKGAKFCGQSCRRQQGMDVMRSKTGKRPRGKTSTALPAVAAGHIGSMWAWPEEQRARYAAREIGLVLCNWLRTNARREQSASHIIDNLDRPAVIDSTPRADLIDFLESHGLAVSGDETFRELVEAAMRIKGTAVTPEFANAWTDYLALGAAA